MKSTLNEDNIQMLKLALSDEDIEDLKEEL